MSGVMQLKQTITRIGRKLLNKTFKEGNEIMDIEIINILTALIKAQYQGSLVFGTNIPDNSLALLWRSNPQEIYMCKDSYNHMNVKDLTEKIKIKRKYAVH